MDILLCLRYMSIEKHQGTFKLKTLHIFIAHIIIADINVYKSRNTETTRVKNMVLRFFLFRDAIFFTKSYIRRKRRDNIQHF